MENNKMMIIAVASIDRCFDFKEKNKPRYHIN